MKTTGNKAKASMCKNIAIITDCSDIALEQVKARLAFLLPKNKLNFFNVIVSPFQIRNGLFLSKLISDEIPHGENTLFLAIVNPLKEKPKRIFGRLKNDTWFVSANSGIFSLLFGEIGIKDVYEDREQRHFPFGGLHVHTSIAGKLLNGVSRDELGNKIDEKEIKNIPLQKGEVVHIDNFGLIKIWNKVGDLHLTEGDRVKLKIVKSGRTLKAIFSDRMMNFNDNTLVVYPGSSLLDKSKTEDIDDFRKSGIIEIGMVRNRNSAKELGICLGDILKIEK